MARKEVRLPGVSRNQGGRLSSELLSRPATQGPHRVGEDELLVTVRPPATEAHYHNPEAEGLLRATLEKFCNMPGARVLLLPRTRTRKMNCGPLEQGNRGLWQNIIPEHVEDGMNIIWNSDLVVSGGGTMNREAAADGSSGLQHLSRHASAPWTGFWHRSKAGSCSSKTSNRSRRRFKPYGGTRNALAQPSEKPGAGNHPPPHYRHRG